MKPRSSSGADAAVICAWLRASRHADSLWAAALDAETPEAAREMFAIAAIEKERAGELARRLP